jgi:hypothetical protein
VIGSLAVVRAEYSWGGCLDNRERPDVVQNLPTAPAARTLALDPRGPRIFLPVADLGPLLPKTGDMPARPAIIPSTFRILTVGR